ncbi:MAG: hypothetical protein ACE369_08990 [Roseovarius sp.]
MSFLLDNLLLTLPAFFGVMIGSLQRVISLAGLCAAVAVLLLMIGSIIVTMHEAWIFMALYILAYVSVVGLSAICTAAIVSAFGGTRL